MKVIYPIEKDVIKRICNDCFVDGCLDYNRFGEIFGLTIIVPEKETTTKSNEDKKIE